MGDLPCSGIDARVALECSLADLVDQDGNRFPREVASKAFSTTPRSAAHDRERTRPAGRGTLPWRLLIEEGSEVTNLRHGFFPVGAEPTLEIAGILTGTNGAAGTGGNAFVGIANVDLSEFTGSIIGTTS